MKDEECRFCNSPGYKEITISAVNDDDTIKDTTFVLNRPVCVSCAVKCLFKGLPLI